MTCRTWWVRSLRNRRPEAGPLAKELRVDSGQVTSTQSMSPQGDSSKRNPTERTQRTLWVYAARLLLECRSMRIVRSAKLLPILIPFLVTANALAGDGSRTYWVSPGGGAPWSACESATPLDGSAGCTLATANANASAGDLVYLREGTYATTIQPANSGTGVNDRIIYRAYTGEHPVIDKASGTYGILLDGKDYIVVEGLEVRHADHLVMISNGSDFNEIAHCLIHDSTGSANGGLNITTLWFGTPNTHNWVHDNVIYNAGVVNPNTCQDESNLMKIGAPGQDKDSSHNTIENNVLYWGGHHVLEVNTIYNVVRNNVFHNEGFMAPEPGCAPCADSNNKYGNRNILFYDGTKRKSTFTLIERNRIGHAGLAPDGNGADNLTLGGNRHIARYNSIFNSMEMGLYLRTSGTDSDGNRVYNNTIYKSGQGPSCRYDKYPGFSRVGVRIQKGADNNVVKNNILYANETLDLKDAGAGNSTTHNWLTGDGDPLFTDPDLTDAQSLTLPDLSLRSGSGAIDAGTHLTLAKGSANNSTTLVVDDALYFQDGTWGSQLSNVRPDWIAIGVTSNTAEISSIDYATNTITLKSARTWTDKAKIWLYRDSRGETVLVGTAPDMGSHEFGANSGGSSGSGGGSAGQGGAGNGGQGGVGNQAGKGGVNGTGNEGGVGGMAGATPSAGEEDSSCGCRAAGSHHPALPAGILVGFGALVATWRRRKSAGSRCCARSSPKG